MTKMEWEKANARERAFKENESLNPEPGTNLWKMFKPRRKASSTLVFVMTKQERAWLANDKRNGWSKGTTKGKHQHPTFRCSRCSQTRPTKQMSDDHLESVCVDCT